MQSELEYYCAIQDARVCMAEYVIEASNCIDAANPDSVGVLQDLAYAIIIRMHEIN